MASSSVRDSPTSQYDGYEPTTFEDVENPPQMQPTIIQHQHQQMLLHQQQETFLQHQQQQMFMQQQQQSFLQQPQRTFAQGSRKVRNFGGPTVEQLQPANNGRTTVGENSTQGIS